MPGSVKLQTSTDPFVRWGQTNVAAQKQAGYHHVTVAPAARRHDRRSDARARRPGRGYGDGTMRLTVEQNVLFKWVKKEVAGAVLRAHRRGGLGAPRRTRSATSSAARAPRAAAWR
jgi:sulfite reductase beta subunit-like hemoprotein